MRILGVTIPDKKRLEIGLVSIYGIGRPRARKILDEAGIDYGKKAEGVSREEENEIRKIVETFKVEGDLKREISINIKRMKDIMCYRGTRHMKKLPLRGQRTKTNSRTVRGNVRKTMGSGKRTAEKK
ncbi:MAG: 30S ribosomal protein S13 [Patescibacteria group bacterium]|nr:MAG: 30S ribosomal protein S13 [Patescibacteria group bacterium]